MTAKAKVDVSAALRNLGAQFRGLDTRDPSSWPGIPKSALLVLVTVLVVGLLWFLWLSSLEDELNAERAREATLRTDYQGKVQRAVSLAALQKQREQVQQYVIILEKQLPSKAEMDALLSDINQAGLGRSLQFDLFRPGQIVLRDYYAELPIALRVSGRFHDIGAFTADIANLSRIVTLNNISVSQSANAKDKTDVLVMEATAKTFRYLDPDEIAAQRAAGEKAKTGGRK